MKTSVYTVLNIHTTSYAGVVRKIPLTVLCVNLKNRFSTLMSVMLRILCNNVKRVVAKAYYKKMYRIIPV